MDALPPGKALAATNVPSPLLSSSSLAPLLPTTMSRLLPTTMSRSPSPSTSRRRATARVYTLPPGKALAATNVPSPLLSSSSLAP